MFPVQAATLILPLHRLRANFHTGEPHRVWENGKKTQNSPTFMTVITFKYHFVFDSRFVDYFEKSTKRFSSVWIIILILIRCSSLGRRSGWTTSRLLRELRSLSLPSLPCECICVFVSEISTSGGIMFI